MNISEKQKLVLLELLQRDKILGIEYLNSIQFQSLKLLSTKLPSNLLLLSDYVSKCSLCSLSKSKISFSFDNGNKNSQIMVVSLFQNNSKELDNLTFLFNTELAIDINHIYMTNILKCNV